MRSRTTPPSENATARRAPSSHAAAFAADTGAPRLLHLRPPLAVGAAAHAPLVPRPPRAHETAATAATTSYPLEDAPQRDRGHHLGGSSSVWRCSRKELAYSSSSSSSDESFAPALEHAWNMMMLCSLMRIVECVTLQSVLSGKAFSGACVCCRVSTRVVQTRAVTCHRPYTTNSCPTAPPGSARGAHFFWCQRKGIYRKASLYCEG